MDIIAGQSRQFHKQLAKLVINDSANLDILSHLNYTALILQIDELYLIIFNKALCVCLKFCVCV